MKRKILGIFVMMLLIVTAIPAVGIFNIQKDFNVQSSIEHYNIVLTGYWNPTGLMIAPFSNNTYLNPSGWKGANWEGLGYNIYSFFPTPGAYNGTFKVDYQDTWNDFWDITAQLHPIAIISFGAGSGPWEIEYNARNLDRWIDDNEKPYQPTPCPPDDSVSVNYVRHSTLPVQAIENAVNNQTSVFAWVDWDGNPGKYLCEYMAYLGMLYQSLHNNTDDAMDATNITIREVIKYLLSFNNPPNPPTITGTINGKAGAEYEYSLTTTDPDNDAVQYYIDWGDGTYEDWFGAATAKHIWSAEDDYTIKAKAKDTYDAESDWSTLEVSMPKNKVINTPFLNFLENHPHMFPLLRQVFGLQ
jgi:hypothetical protein